MNKYLFVDRDGTLIEEPADFQIDSLEKFRLVTGVIPALLSLQSAGFKLVMITNQDGLGTSKYPQSSFELVQSLMMQVLTSQGIRFEKILICPHFEEDRCQCRKPQTSLVQEYLARPNWDRTNSYVIGDRETDLKLAANMGIAGLRIGSDLSWEKIAEQLVNAPRFAVVERKTKETQIHLRVQLDGSKNIQVSTGIGFFDHMLEQIAKHGGFGLEMTVKGDLEIDDHHTIEDTGLALGEGLKRALGDKIGIGRYGFLLPMDETQVQVALDLSGRPFFKFDGKLGRESVGGLATEMVPHFFRSLAESLGANLHIKVEGDNTHHQIEAMFKGVGRSLRQAITLTAGEGLPSTKGLL